MVWLRVARQHTLLVCLLAGATPVKAQQPGWSATGSLGARRSFGHTATLLANGKVLVVGGNNVSNPCCRATGSAELYDPATGQWSATGSLSTPRLGHIAVRLANGKVLVAGGRSGYFPTTVVTTAEIYDPDTGAWSAAGNFSVARQGATVTLLADGWLLVAGGWSDADSASVNSAELYDPVTGVWSPAGTMNSARSGHTATLLANGQVLVVSGYSSSGLRSAELYDPATGSWTATGDLITAGFSTRDPTLLPNGKVLVAGGERDVYEYCIGVTNAQLYDPATGQWSATASLTAPRGYHTTTLLPNGKVLVAGGTDSECNTLKSAELYDPATGSWSVTGSLNTARGEHTATLLANGKVLVVGGYDGNSGRSPTSVELFDSGTATVASVSAASFAAGGALAPESIAAAFGANLATDTQTAPSLPLPAQLAGVSVKGRDRVGAERLAPLFFVSPGQINYQVPPGTAAGLATVTVTSGDSFVAAGMVEIAGVAPGLFSANASGQGVAAALALRLKADGTQQYEPIARFDSAQNRFVAEPIDLGPETDQVFLVLFGTGIKFRSALSAVSSTIGGASGEVLFADAAPGFVGLDQVNLRISRSLVGRGEVDVALSVDGKAANRVRVSIR
ncbi:MAG: kelch repeat-containing protein [Blastocatellia bacterium]